MVLEVVMVVMVVVVVVVLVVLVVVVPRCSRQLNAERHSRTSSACPS